MQSGKTPPKGIWVVLVRNPGQVKSPVYRCYTPSTLKNEGVFSKGASVLYPDPLVPSFLSFSPKVGPSWWWAFRNTLAASLMQSGTTPPKGIGDVLVRNPGPGKISRVSVLYTEHVKERRGSFRKELGSGNRIPLYLPFFLFKCHFHALPWAKLLVVERAVLKLDLKATTLSPPG